jgi:hypothetical protein
LDKEFAAKKKIMIDDALSKLHEKYDKLRDQMLKRQQDELAALQVGLYHHEENSGRDSFKFFKINNSF